VGGSAPRLGARDLIPSKIIGINRRMVNRGSECAPRRHAKANLNSSLTFQ
jgi:hypothetical protein